MPNVIATFGQFNQSPGSDEFLVAVNFPSLMTMDQFTPDDRRMLSSGFGARPMPFAIMAQFQTLPGHFEAYVVGTLQEITFWDDGNVSGKGWLVNTEEGRKMALLLRTGALRQNSVDLADVTYIWEWKSDDPNDPDFWEYTITFTQWKVATTTFVNIPAFPDARGEISASMFADPIEVTSELVAVQSDADEIFDEIMADGSLIQPFADFHLPEPPMLTPLTVTDDGCVFFHLAAWGKPHRGMTGNVVAPRPADYSSFNASQVLTDRGPVGTGPLFLFNGHPGELNGRAASQAYGGVENAWADVRITNGRLGPWGCGRVRPGVSEEKVYAARASRLSGHWVGKDLAAVVSVNVPAFDVPRREEAMAAFAIGEHGLNLAEDGAAVRDGELVEMVASLHVENPFAVREVIKQRTLAQMTQADGTIRITPSTIFYGTTSSPTMKSIGQGTQIGSVTQTSTTHVEVDIDVDEALGDEVQNRVTEALSRALAEAMEDPMVAEAIDRIANGEPVAADDDAAAEADALLAEIEAEEMLAESDS